MSDEFRVNRCLPLQEEDTEESLKSVREEGRNQHLAVYVRSEGGNHQDGVEEFFNYPIPYFVPLEKKGILLEFNLQIILHAALAAFKICKIFHERIIFCFPPVLYILLYPI